MVNKIPDHFLNIFIPGFNLDFVPKTSIEENTEYLESEEELKQWKGFDGYNEEFIMGKQFALHGRAVIATIYEDGVMPMVSYLCARRTETGILYEFLYEETEDTYGVYKLTETKQPLTFGQLIYAMDRFDENPNWDGKGLVFGLIYTILRQEYGENPSLEDIIVTFNQIEGYSYLYPDLNRWYETAKLIYLRDFKKNYENPMFDTIKAMFKESYRKLMRGWMP